MATPITTIKIPTGSMLHLATSRMGGQLTVLDGKPFNSPANYWVARITPPSMDQRRDAYRGRTRPFERRYLTSPSGFPKHQIDIKDFTYGFAYEFGGDRVTGDTRFPARVYAIYLGTNGTGTVAEFRIYESADLAMFAERQREYLEGSPANVPPAPARTSTLLQMPEALSTRMEALYTEMVQHLATISALEHLLKDAGYHTSVPDPNCALFEDARRVGKAYAGKAWAEKFLPVVQAEAIRLGEEAQARQKAQEAPAPAPAPAPQTASTSPVAPPSSLLDAIAEEHEAVVHTPAPAPAPAPAPLNRLTREADVLARKAAPATSAKELKAMQQRAKAERTRNHVAAAARKATTTTPGSFPRPSTIPAPVGDDLPF